VRKDLIGPSYFAATGFPFHQLAAYSTLIFPMVYHPSMSFPSMASNTFGLLVRGSMSASWSTPYRSSPSCIFPAPVREISRIPGSTQWKFAGDFVLQVAIEFLVFNWKPFRPACPGDLTRRH